MSLISYVMVSKPDNFGKVKTVARIQKPATQHQSKRGSEFQNARLGKYAKSAADRSN